MVKRMKEVLFYAVCYYCGLVSFVRRRIRRSGKQLIILNYHDATGGDLRRHLLYLRCHYRVLHLEEALEELYAPGEPKKRGGDRRTPLVLTFDDGYRDNYTRAFPLACEFRVPFTIFLTPGYIESRNYNSCWWQAGDYLVEHARVDEAAIEGHTFHLDRPEERETLARAIYTRACYARSVAEREAFLAAAREALDVPSIIPTEKEAILSWEEIIEMEGSGWVSFGGHTMHHPVLAYLETPAEVRSEVSECRTILEQQLGHPVRTFAYPIGKDEHIGKEALSAVRDAGYGWAVTTIFGSKILKVTLYSFSVSRLTCGSTGYY
jgi:peptidoglycan/xylan/chitin deacetylase (PgdA/CDA1 family)